MNIGIHVSFSVMVSSRYMPSTGIAGHMVVLFLVFQGISILYSIVVVSIFISTYSVRVFPFLHSLSTFIVCRFSDGGILPSMR